MLEGVAYLFSRGSSWPRNRTGVSCIAGERAIREALLIDWAPPAKWQHYCWVMAVSVGSARREHTACLQPWLLHQPGERLCCGTFCYLLLQLRRQPGENTRICSSYGPWSFLLASLLAPCLPWVQWTAHTERHSKTTGAVNRTSSVTQLCPTLCDLVNRSTSGLPVHHQLPESTQTHVHWVGDAIQPSHPLSSPSPPALNLSQHQGLFQWVIRWPKHWSFSFNISPSNEHPGLISFRMDWLDLLAVQGTLKSLLQHHSLKASILRCSAFFTVQLSHPYVTTGKTMTLTGSVIH